MASPKAKPTQWEVYKAAREKAMHVPPLSKEDQTFLDTPGPWARSGHFNLSQTMTAYKTQRQTLSRGGSLPALHFLPEGKMHERGQDRVSFAASVAMGVPLTEEVLGARSPPRGRQAPQLRSDSASSAREKGLPPYCKLDEFDPGVPAKRPFVLHSPCRDFNFQNTKAW
mmetsp:Transcript_98522/g.175498  ORF Transcript_98522/g.175498 Transcript_98522/m.175498 type:complete len:169 (-) Transcript_98522:22-528(-)